MTLTETGKRNSHGYRSAAYAEAILQPGEHVVPLPAAGGWAVSRPIDPIGGGEVAAFDGSACYPLCSLSDWDQLPGDLKNLSPEWISFCAVVDPLDEVSAGTLEQCFPDRLIPFKTHFLVDFSGDAEVTEIIDRSHLRKARKGLRETEVRHLEEPAEIADSWVTLYGNLIERHSIQGVAAFSEASLRAQLDVPGVEPFACYNEGGECIGIVLFLRDGDRAYYHLGAYSEEGYQQRVSFGIFLTAFEWLRGQGVRVINLGGGAGLTVEPGDGLARFKKGWSNASGTAYFGGVVLQRDEYMKRSGGSDDPGNFFPAYRGRN